MNQPKNDSELFMKLTYNVCSYQAVEEAGYDCSNVDNRFEIFIFSDRYAAAKEADPKSSI